MEECSIEKRNLEPENGSDKSTNIHMDLNSLFVAKTDIDKVIFGLYKYTTDKGYFPPFIFTANTSSKDNSYLGVLKNNNVRLIDNPPKVEDVCVLFSDKWKRSLYQLTIIPNMPVFTKIDPSRVCIYIDWDNIQVSLEYIPAFIDGIKTFIHDIKVHSTYEFYVFLHNKIHKNTKQALIKSGAQVITIIKDKAGCGDGEMLRFIRRNTRPGDSICVASGDRDFSPLMVEYVQNSYNVFLVYNRQALYTFKHNRHWLGSIDVKSFDGVGTKISSTEKVKRKSSFTQNTKPCKFYNLSTCTAVSCSFLHICGVCGRPHRMQDFHPHVTIIKNIICKKYNNRTCRYSGIDCEYLHVCMKCKKNHRYTDCKYIIMHCPICNVTMETAKSYVMHQVDPIHVERFNTVKRITQNTVPEKGHVLVV